jgi:hypothetical protein
VDIEAICVPLEKLLCWCWFVGLATIEGADRVRKTSYPPSAKSVLRNGNPEQGRHDENSSIAILYVGRMNDGMEQEA